MSSVEDAQDALDAIVRVGNELPLPRMLGLQVLEVAIGHCVVALPDTSAAHNHIATVHAVAQLAPIEFAAAVAVASRLQPLRERGMVGVLASLTCRYRQLARGRLRARATVHADALRTATAEVASGETPRVEVAVDLLDEDDVVVSTATLAFAYIHPPE